MSLRVAVVGSGPAGFYAAEHLLADYRRHLPDAPAPLRFGTWIGGDADGNPNAGADTVREALERARTLLRLRYRDEVQIDVQQVGKPVLTPRDVALPDLVQKRLTHASTLARLLDLSK